MTADERQIVQHARDQHVRDQRRKPEPPPPVVVDEPRARRVREYNRDLIRELNEVALERAQLEEKQERDRRTARVRADLRRAGDLAAVAQGTPVYARVRAACALGSPIDLDAHATLIAAVVLRAQGALA